MPRRTAVRSDSELQRDCLDQIGRWRWNRAKGRRVGLPMCELLHSRVDLIKLKISTIGTYQTLSNVERLKKFDPSKFKLVIVDEAHHAAAFS